jgi:hypothetical protein
MERKSMSVIEKIEEIFGDPEKFSPENMQHLLHETLEFFGDLKFKLESKDEKVRNDALESAAVLKTKLEEQALELCKSIGMDPNTLENYLNDPSHFTPEELGAIENTKAEMDAFKAELGINLSGTPTPKKKKPKTVKDWLVG